MPRRRTLPQPKRPTLREALVFILDRAECLLDAQIIAARAIDPQLYPRAQLRTQAEVRAYKDMMEIQARTQEPKP